MNDTFGEAYHVPTLHKLSASTTTCPLATVQVFGPTAGRMTFGKFTTQIMADKKIEESRWAEPAVNQHLFHIYHLAPNTNILMFPNNMVKAQCWPGRHVGECTVQFFAYQDVPPTPDTLSKFKT